MSFESVTKFEQEIAKFFGAPYAVAVDSCTHGLELCLRLTGVDEMTSPQYTYLSVPMLADKIGIELVWIDCEWTDYYYITENIIDAAVYWKKDGYIPNTFMCISHQYQKHLSLGRCGTILCPDKETAYVLKKLSYDGREPNIPWRDQNVTLQGFHYYATPETCQLGLDKLQDAINRTPKIWGWMDYRDLTQMDAFKF